ncbi:casein kinase 1 alpha [Clonorchis sinensis]|uniref:Casein kinase 1 alpha n=1 Tax=Clonorchis sinensis TaxID=79923 RepID=G7Y9D5_CLOSI|nr:casein kinase 1 alpha [Clonorchis sinensis]
MKPSIHDRKVFTTRVESDKEMCCRNLVMSACHYKKSKEQPLFSGKLAYSEGVSTTQIATIFEISRYMYRRDTLEPIIINKRFSWVPGTCDYQEVLEIGTVQEDKLRWLNIVDTSHVLMLARRRFGYLGPTIGMYAVSAERLRIDLMRVVIDTSASHPYQFAVYLNYCRGLRFEESPDYMYVRQLLRILFRTMSHQFDCLRLDNAETTDRCDFTLSYCGSELRRSKCTNSPAGGAPRTKRS